MNFGLPAQKFPQINLFSSASTQFFICIFVSMKLIFFTFIGCKTPTFGEPVGIVWWSESFIVSDTQDHSLSPTWERFMLLISIKKLLGEVSNSSTSHQLQASSNEEQKAWCYWVRWTLATTQCILWQGHMTVTDMTYPTRFTLNLKTESCCISCNSWLPHIWHKPCC